jgi:hypothetical protein
MTNQGEHKSYVPATRDIAYGGVFGAAALLLPVLFHALHLGSVFMPMYLPLVALGFFARPAVAMLTSLIVPNLSAAFTGMPPLYPPIAPVMAAELAVMAGMISWLSMQRPHLPILLLLIPALIFGRVINTSLMYLLGVLFGLPPEFLAGLSFIAGWPGIILMIVVIPATVRLMKPRSSLDGQSSNDSTRDA